MALDDIAVSLRFDHLRSKSRDIADGFQRKGVAVDLVENCPALEKLGK